jgi:hypothetical protein
VSGLFVDFEESFPVVFISESIREDSVEESLILTEILNF